MAKSLGDDVTSTVISGIRVSYDAFGAATALATSEFTTVYSEGVTPSEVYTVLTASAGALPEIEFTTTNRADLQLDGTSLNSGFLDGADDWFQLGEIAWDDGGTARSTTVLRVWDAEEDALYQYVLAGDALPALTTVAEFEAWEADITGYAAATGDFAAGESIDLSTSLYASTTENDTIHGTDEADEIDGGAGNDRIYGGDGDDVISGGAGADVLHGDDGIDTLSFAEETGSGGVDLTLSDWALITDTYGNRDTVYDFENVIGSTNDDRIYGSAGDNVIYLGDGDDTGWGRIGDDYVYGEGGFDVIKGGGGNDVLDGGGTQAEDELSYDGASGSIVADFQTGIVVETPAFNPSTIDQFSNFLRIRGTDGNDTLRGDEEDNEFVGGRGSDTIDGRGGDGDRVRYDLEEPSIFTTSLRVDLSQGWALYDGSRDYLTNIEIIDGTSRDDSFIGDDNANTFFGHFGADTMDGGAGDDVLHGGEGADIIDGGEGYDLWSVEYDYLSGIERALDLDLSTGGATDTFGSTDTLTNIEGFVATHLDDTMKGDDDYNVFYGLAGDDSIDGGGGKDGISFERDALHGGTSGVVVRMADGTATDGFGDTDTFVNITQVYATEYDDEVYGDENTSRIDGFGGNDTLISGASDYIDIYAGEGNDIVESYATISSYLVGGAGNDIIRGFGAEDWVSYWDEEIEGGTQGVEVNLEEGWAIDSFGDTDTLSGIEGVHGTDKGDSITASDSGSSIYGWDGADVLTGGAAYDILVGGAGADYIDASASDGVEQGDYVNPGRGRDTIIGSSALFAEGRGIFVSLDGVYVTSGVRFDTSLDGTGFITSLSGDEIDTTFTAATRLGGTYLDDEFYGSDYEDENFFGFQGHDHFDGGDGHDRVSYYLDYNWDAEGITADLGAGVVTDGWGYTDTLVSIEGITATNFDDDITGSEEDNWFLDGGGTDIVRGLGGDDTFENGGGKADTFDGGEGSDWFISDPSFFVRIEGDIAQINLAEGWHGGTATAVADRDTLISIENVEYRGTEIDQVVIIGSSADNHLIAGEADDEVSGGAGDDTLEGMGGDDLLVDSFGDNGLSGGDGEDTLVVLTGRNTLDGGAENDVLVGGSGSDDLQGGSGDDVLLGDTSDRFFGNDRLAGGAGNDLLEAGRGADVFVFAANEGHDIIADFDFDPADPLAATAVGADFAVGLDRLDLSAMGYATAAEAQSHITDVDGHATFSDQDTSFTLFGVSAADLTDDCFIL